MKKIFLIICLFYLSANSQTYKIEFNKQEELKDLKEMNAEIIKINSELLNINKILNNENYILTNDYMKEINNQIITSIFQTYLIDFIYDAANIDDKELITEFNNFKILVNNLIDTYELVKEKHFNNIYNLQTNNQLNESINTIIAKSIDMFIGIPLFSTLKQIINSN